MQRYGWLSALLLGSTPVWSMQALDDAGLASVSGRGGISIEASGGGWSADSLEYREDGQSLRVEGISSRAQQAGSRSTTPR